MEVAKAFFQDEVREGFFIPNMMKCCWAAQLEVLEEIDKICKRHSIPYFADSGTLIGAVRHHGYIPWDDDLDIIMLREDYEAFLEVADELPDDFSVLNWRWTDEWTNIFTRIVNTQSIRFDGSFLDKYHGFPYSAGVDLFVLDYMYRDRQLEQERRERAHLVQSIAAVIRNEKTMGEDAWNLIDDAESKLGFTIDGTKNVVIQLCHIVDEYLSEVRREDADDVCFMPVWLQHDATVTPKKYYDESIRVPFEYSTIPIPIYYDEVLHIRYGDYMKAFRNGGMHNYPYYGVQEEIVSEQYGWKNWNYSWNPNELSLGEQIRQDHQLQLAEVEQQMKDLEALAETSPAIYDSLKGQIDALKQMAHISSTGIKDVVFLTVGGEAWENFHYFWEKEMSRDDTRVFVIPIPYFDWKMDGKVTEEHYITTGFPEGVEVISFNDYNLEGRRPSRIYFQIPFDGQNPSWTVDPHFYSPELLKCTDELVYVPFLPIREIEDGDDKSYFGMNYYVKMPGILHADRIILPTENLRDKYIQALVDFGGEENRGLWEAKTEVEDYIPKRGAVQGKKKMYFFTDGAPFAIYGDRAVEKLRENLKVFFEASKDIELLWQVSGNLEEILFPGGADVYEEFLSIYEDYEREQWGKIIDPDDETAIHEADAFYGDPGYMAHLANVDKIPVMIRNMEI